MRVISLDSLRAAFDGSDVAQKNIALRHAYDELALLRSQKAEADADIADLRAAHELIEVEVTHLRSQKAALEDAAETILEWVHIQAEREGWGWNSITTPDPVVALAAALNGARP